MSLFFSKYVVNFTSQIKYLEMWSFKNGSWQFGPPVPYNDTFEAARNCSLWAYVVSVYYPKFGITHAHELKSFAAF